MELKSSMSSPSQWTHVSALSSVTLRSLLFTVDQQTTSEELRMVILKLLPHSQIKCLVDLLKASNYLRHLHLSVRNQSKSLFKPKIVNFPPLNKLCKVETDLLHLKSQALTKKNNPKRIWRLHHRWHKNYKVCTELKNQFLLKRELLDVHLLVEAQSLTRMWPHRKILLLQLLKIRKVTSPKCQKISRESVKKTTHHQDRVFTEKSKMKWWASLPKSKSNSLKDMKCLHQESLSITKLRGKWRVVMSTCLDNDHLIWLISISNTQSLTMLQQVPREFQAAVQSKILKIHPNRCSPKVVKEQWQQLETTDLTKISASLLP
jgi:hypothetical protein